MFKNYFEPELKVVELQLNDVVTASPAKGEGNQDDIFGNVWGEEEL